MTTPTSTEPEPCPECRGVPGRDCAVCDGVGHRPYAPPPPPLGGRLFDPAIIPDVEPPGLPKK